MASLANDPGGTRRVLVMVDGRRKTVRLGKMPKKQAEAVLRHIEALAAARASGVAPREETVVWVSSVSDAIRERLERAGLVDRQERRRELTVGELIEQYTDRKLREFKPSTVRNNKQSFRSVLKYIGEEKLVRDVTPGDATDFRSSLIGEGLAEATIRKRCSIASSLFRYAVNHRIIDREPFSESKVPRASISTAHKTMIAETDAVKILGELPDAQWRLLFALSRWGGLRVGSEPRLLTHADVNWQAMRIRVRSPKTERHAGHAERFIPIFPELQNPLLEVQEAAEPGQELLLPFLMRRSDASLRKPLLAAIERAGVSEWPRLWHSMRATRQTELEQRHPTHVVCAWLGNSQAVAGKHYLMVTDEDYAKAAQKAAQQAAAGSSTEAQEERDAPADAPSVLVDATPCDCSQESLMLPLGLEPGFAALG